MRFYDLQTKTVKPSNGSISTVSGKIPWTGANSAGVVRQWTSFPNGSYDPGALDIVFDLQIVPGHTPSGASVISVHGVNIEDLYGANNFAGAELSLYAGMVGGLPLSAAQPSPGLLVNAAVYGAFGNWQGTEQTLDFVIVPSTYTNENPGNIVFNWQPGQSFKDAITQTLNVAWPNSTATVIVNPSLMISDNQPRLHFCSTATGLAHFIHDHTRGWKGIGKNYPGVHCYFNGSQITVTDFSQSVGPTIALTFADIIGQPTWLEAPVLTINTVLRADIQVGSYITLPKGDTAGPGSVLTVGSLQAAALQNKLTFSGKFYVKALRAVGQFRGTGDDDWVCVIQAVPVDL